MKTRHGKWSVLASFTALASLGLLIPISEADGQRRGGGRAGASAHHSGGAHRSSQVRSSAKASVNHGGRSHASTANRGGNRSNINTGGNRSNINTGGNRTNINTGGNRTNINTGDINIDRDVDIDVDNHCCGWGDWDNDWDDHPIATGVAIGTAAAVTSWALGSYYRTLPSNCVAVVRGAVTYYQCGTYWYQPVYSGMNVQYVAINAP